MDKSKWIVCPVCGSKTRNKIREDTELKNFPLFCPKCKQETLVNVKGLKYHSYQRARRTDAEPITRSTMKLLLSALFL